MLTVEVKSVLIPLPCTAVRMVEMVHKAALVDMFELNFTVDIAIKQMEQRRGGLATVCELF